MYEGISSGGGRNFLILCFARGCKSTEVSVEEGSNTLEPSAVHRSRRAGAGVLTYFAGAGVCSPPVKL